MREAQKDKQTKRYTDKGQRKSQTRETTGLRKTEREIIKQKKQRVNKKDKRNYY